MLAPAVVTIPRRMAWLSAALLLAALCVSHAAAWGWGRASGAHQAAQQQAEREAKASAQQAQQRQAQQRRSQAVATRAEAARELLTVRFAQLDRDAEHDPVHPADACVLPAERLRRWADANAGPDAAAGQPDHAASAIAAAGLGGAARPGGKPPHGGPAVPPAGDPLLRSAAAPAGEP